ncbi:LacI family transcriptional regulator [Streptosporangium becharense]|uniref:LacI family transcriptional regulator n=1 Tax=Streptosporangium becharense TaxID=1816182 RepID=A0A7W9MF36_9ACTN|nr:LacI family DNA-binding transcriptional regulator [Streptosporangium becharense]MBB2912060.1 LacI family transcriptional regulator [Streptosporangium becharense]MBB5818607.1 LacI family transcriptional regulator [Streptosporangium becharense]
MAATLRDVAAAAGVSVSTASRALSGSPEISEGTRRRVSRAARSMGYRRNLAAASLRTRRSGLVGLVLGDLGDTTFHTVVEAVQRHLRASGYQALLCVTDADAAVEADCLRLLRDHRVDSVLIAGTGENVKGVDELRAAGITVIDLIRGAEGSRGPAVLAADREGAVTATRHLLAQGHRRIAFVGGPPGTAAGHDRYAGFVQTLAEAGVTPDPALVCRGPSEGAFGARAMRGLLAVEPAPTALVLGSNGAAYGALPVLAGSGVEVPGALSVVAFEDTPLLEWWNPAITVVDTGARELGRLAAELLLRSVGGQELEPRRYVVGAELVVRASTAPPRAP